jgi:glycosyltransferase involved in cell wall biosynthesis
MFEIDVFALHPRMVLTALMALHRLSEDYEVIVVNGGSADYTAEALRELVYRYLELRVTHYEQNRGYGGAMRTDFENASKDHILLAVMALCE